LLSYRSALTQATDRLSTAGIQGAAFEARMLLWHVLGLPPGAVPDRDAEVDETRLKPLLARRCAREPMALILGHQGFWTLDLAVSRDTLIPRPDSEALIEAALAARPDRAAVRRVLDLGTGTGCLLLAALVEFPAAWGVGVELVPQAAALAARNAVANGLAGRAAFLAGRWAEALAGSGGFDLVLSNPPYIESRVLAGLMPEVAGFEPESALDGGADGLAAYRALVPALPGLLAPGGVAVLELGQGQAESVGDLARAAGFMAPALQSDLAGIARAMVLRVGPV
jgi:release factor glutamine methyltransferase